MYLIPRILRNILGAHRQVGVHCTQSMFVGLSLSQVNIERKRHVQPFIHPGSYTGMLEKVSWGVRRDRQNLGMGANGLAGLGRANRFAGRGLSVQGWGIQGTKYSLIGVRGPRVGRHSPTAGTNGWVFPVSGSVLNT